MQDCMEHASRTTQDKSILPRLQDCVTGVDHVAIAVVNLIARRGGAFTDKSVEELFRTFEMHGLY